MGTRYLCNSVVIMFWSLSYEGLITRTGLSKLTDINEKLLEHYAQGVRNPRPQQREKIVRGFHQIAKELLEVE